MPCKKLVLTHKAQCTDCGALTSRINVKERPWLCEICLEKSVHLIESSISL